MAGRVGYGSLRPTSQSDQHGASSPCLCCRIWNRSCNLEHVSDRLRWQSGGRLPKHKPSKYFVVSFCAIATVNPKSEPQAPPQSLDAGVKDVGNFFSFSRIVFIDFLMNVVSSGHAPVRERAFSYPNSAVSLQVQPSSWRRFSIGLYRPRCRTVLRRPLAALICSRLRISLLCS